jgi:6-phosphogluconolactonase (cycloisomerase 2 family)
MRSRCKLVLGASLTAFLALALPVTAASADAGGQHGTAAPAVFAQTNDPEGNAILVYSRGDDGTLTAGGSFATGGAGAIQPGAVVDPLASQGSVVYDRADNLLFTVNAGSDTISAFAVNGLQLSLRQVIASGGSFPTSLAVRGDLLYALNAGGDGAVRGFRIAGEKLHAINGSTRTLGLGNANPPFFLDSPGQVGFTPDGHQLIVTTKSHGTIDVFGVLPDGRLAAGVENPSASAVPFAFDFDADGQLAVISAGASALTSYDVAPDGVLTRVSGPVADTQQAGCWIAGVPGGFFYIGNTASASLSTFHVDHGVVSLQVAATPTAGGPIDLAVPSNGAFVYSETGGAGTIDEFSVGANGALTPIGQVTGLAAHVIEGIAAT